MINNNSSKVEQLIQKNIDLIKKNFSCTICLEYFENPILTNCGHSFCKKCIENYIGSKRTQTCPLCKKSINVRSLQKSDMMKDIVLRVINLEKKFQTEVSSIELTTVNEKPASHDQESNQNLLEVPNAIYIKRKRNSSTESNLKNLKKLKSNEVSSNKTSVIKDNQSLCNETILDQDDDENKNEKVEKWIENSKTCHSGNDIRNFNQNENITSYIEPLADSTNIIIENTHIKNKSPILKINDKPKIIPIENKLPLIILDTCIDLVDSTCSTNSKNLVITEPESSREQNEPIINNQDPKQPIFNNGKENEPEKLDNPLKFTKETSVETNTINFIQPMPKSNKKIETNNNTRKFLFNSNINNQTTKKNQPDEIQAHENSNEIPIHYEPNHSNVLKDINKNRKRICFFKLGKLKHELAQDQENLVKKTTLKKDISTNTPFIGKSNASTQTQTEFLFDYSRFENDLFNKIYLLLEDELLNEEFNNITNYHNKNRTSYSTFVPNSPPIGIIQHPQSYLCEDTISTDATIILPDNSPKNKKINKKLTDFNESIMSKSRRTKPPLKKAIPQLEFLDKSQIAVSNQDENKSDSDSNYVTSSDEMIIVETPEKEKQYGNSMAFKQMSEIDRTLSRSANRTELVNSKIIFENSIVRYENSFDSSSNNNNNTILVENNNENNVEKAASFIADSVKLNQEPLKNIPDTIKMIPDTVGLVSDSVKMIPDTVGLVSDSVKMIPDTIKNMEHINEEKTNQLGDQTYNKLFLNKQQNISNHSFMNSMLNSSVSNTMILPAPLLSLNSTSLENQSLLYKLPPQASDILGTSYLSASTINQSILHKSSSESKDKTANDLDTNLSRNSNCTDSNQDQSNSNKTSNTALEFVGSLLKSDMKIMLKNFAETINASVKNDISDTTTHLIVDSTDDLYCGVTSKYLKAISKKIWIVSFKWIVNCVKEGHLVNEDNFEIIGDSIFKQHNAPQRSRQSSSLLFDNYGFLFIGNFNDDTINLEEIIELSKKNGAIVVGKVKEFGNANLKSRVILYDEKMKKFSRKEIAIMERNNIHTVTKSWFIDSLACYTVKEMREYQNFDD